MITITRAVLISTFIPLVVSQAGTTTTSTVVVSAGTPIWTSTIANTPLSLSSLIPTPSVPAVSTAIASPSAAPEATLPSQIALPPKQAWCPSEIFCAGALLQTVNLAFLYPDDKTFIDKPTAKPSKDVINAFAPILASQNATYANVTNFVNTNFRGEGLELEALSLPASLLPPSFLNNITDPLVKAWSATVHGFWGQLVRGTNSSTLCDGVKCESSLIPLNHTFVVPGGRFREQYYWDSFWIVEGLIESELFDIVNGTLQNFMDEIERFGFIPNGGRIYYLNRSQPPLFIHMLARYVTATNDTSILARGLPLAEAELTWWQKNRSVNVTSSYTNQTHTVWHFAVNNSAPRPESYRTDYVTANSGSLNETGRSALYSELASGAESGWDYSSRWLNPAVAGPANLTTLDVKNTLPVCLNSILYSAHVELGKLYSRTNISGTAGPPAARRHFTAAVALRTAILDLFWDARKLAFYDYNIRAKTRNTIFTAAAFYPLWNGIVPDEIVKNATSAFGVFSSLNLVLNRWNGTFPVTFLETGLQWDAPNTWPPHQYIALQALRALPSNVTSGAFPTIPANQSTFALIPAGQLGLEESALPSQPLHDNQNSTIADLNRLNGTVVNGGNATEGEGWGKALERQLANRYFTSAFCSWYATGGSIPGALPRLSDAELNVTESVTNTGNMFEKFSNLDIDSAGRGGEYTVQAGFGWTNGVVLWVASTYGKVLVAPKCPSLLAEQSTIGASSSASASITIAASVGGSPIVAAPSGSAGAGNGAATVGGSALSAVLAVAIGVLSLSL